MLNFDFQLPRITVFALLDIVIVATLVYQAIMMVRGRRAAPIFAGLGLVVVLYFLATRFNLELTRTILANLVPYTAFALIVLFQSDIRRALARIGRGGWIGFRRGVVRRETIADIVLAVSRMSRDRTGALIVIERNIGLRTFIESGVPLDAYLSRDLLLSIFQPGSPLHDGAVIVQGDRIAAAAAFLPLSMNPNISRTLGTRHRAAIGVTEETDAIAVVVSEETGRISIAANGNIELDVTVEYLEQRLLELLAGSRGSRRPATGFPSRQLAEVEPVGVRPDFVDDRSRSE